MTFTLLAQSPFAKRIISIFYTSILYLQDRRHKLQVSAFAILIAIKFLDIFYYLKFLIEAKLYGGLPKLSRTNNYTNLLLVFLCPKFIPEIMSIYFKIFFINFLCTSRVSELICQNNFYEFSVSLNFSTPFSLFLYHLLHFLTPLVPFRNLVSCGSRINE